MEVIASFEEGVRTYLKLTEVVGVAGERDLSLFLVYPPTEDSNLVDPASSHMLVLKIKPCMSKYK
jgi:hypothetical protein